MHRRITITTEPDPDPSTRYRFGTAAWPARWLGPAKHDPDQSLALLFRRVVRLKRKMTARVHLSADQRYEFFVDGKFVGRGPERSDLKSWVYESYELDLKAGEHTLVIKLWWISPTAPAAEAQQTHAPAVLLFAEGDANELLSTGVAPWQYRRLPGYEFFYQVPAGFYFATGAQISIDGRLVRPEIEAGEGHDWLPVRNVETPALAAMRRETAPYWHLRPAHLPEMLEKQLSAGTARHVQVLDDADTARLPIVAEANLADEQAKWNALLTSGKRLTVPAHTSRRVVIDLGNYYCAYPQLCCSGKNARIRLQTAESLYTLPEKANDVPRIKGNRDEIEGKVFIGVGIQITTGESEYTYQPHTFMAGRYIELIIRTADEPLVIRGLGILETHFPFSFAARFASSDPAHEQIIPIALRTIEMCSHDTSMDCPYYERLNYVGDTRLQSLVAYTWANDDRLARKCIQMFDLSRQPSGLTYSRYPTRTVQTIPPFSLWWVSMVHDFAMWRDDLRFVEDRMIGVRSVIDAWRKCLDENGLLRSPAGWNFVDWVPGWSGGCPAGAEADGFSGILNLQMIYTLQRAAELEELVGEPLLATRHRRFAAALAPAVAKAFFDRKRGLFANDLEHSQYSEHAQCLAVLTGVAPPRSAAALIDRMLAAHDLAQATIYFSHYLFETLGQVGRVDPLLDRLNLWKQLQPHGFRTTFESPEPSRSDCHAWGAHPLYHMLATIAGIRPADPGFRSIVIRPQLGALRHITGQLPHPKGVIDLALDSNGTTLTGQITLPKGLPGTLRIGASTKSLKAGRNRVNAKIGK